MAQLVTVVISIVLLAIVVAGGSNYLRVDTGVRISSAESVVTGFGVVEAAFRSYNVANRGASPTPDDAAVEPGVWVKEIAPYLPDGRMPALDGFEWSYGSADAGRVICLTSVGAGEAAIEGMSVAAARIGADIEICDETAVSIGKSLN